jgi:hypothetical protein
VKFDQHASQEYDNMQNQTSFIRSFVLDQAGTYTAQFIVNDGTIDGDSFAVTIDCASCLLRTAQRSPVLSANYILSDSDDEVIGYAPPVYFLFIIRHATVFPG